jgi:hypothetical protein
VRPHVDLRYATHYDSETSDHADEESSHPGGFVLRQCIELFGLTITQAAAALGVRDHFSTRRL